MRHLARAAQNIALVVLLRLDGNLLDTRSRRHATALAALLLVFVGVCLAVTGGAS